MCIRIILMAVISLASLQTHAFSRDPSHHFEFEHDHDLPVHTEERDNPFTPKEKAISDAILERIERRR